MQNIQLWRNRLNMIVLVLPGQWFGLMAFYWIRFYPPLQPFQFETPFPSPTVFLLGCAVSCLPFLLPRRYFVPWEFERGKFYLRLGIRWFRYFAPDGDLVNQILRRIQPSYRVVDSREALQKHIDGTYSNEKWHLSFFLAGMFTALHALQTKQYTICTLLTLTNVVFNLLPVMHQRYKRARLRRFSTIVV